MCVAADCYCLLRLLRTQRGAAADGKVMWCEKGVGVKAKGGDRVKKETACSEKFRKKLPVFVNNAKGKSFFV